VNPWNTNLDSIRRRAFTMPQIYKFSTYMCNTYARAHCELTDLECMQYTCSGMYDNTLIIFCLTTSRSLSLLACWPAIGLFGGCG
jgi:hypothetical protein